MYAIKSSIKAGADTATLRNPLADPHAACMLTPTPTRQQNLTSSGWGSLYGLYFSYLVKLFKWFAAKEVWRDFPAGSVLKNPPCNECRGRGFDP